MLQHLKQEAANMIKKIELLEAAKRLEFLNSVHYSMFTFTHSRWKNMVHFLFLQEILGRRFRVLFH